MKTFITLCFYYVIVRKTRYKMLGKIPKFEVVENLQIKTFQMYHSDEIFSDFIQFSVSLFDEDFFKFLRVTTDEKSCL